MLCLGSVLPCLSGPSQALVESFIDGAPISSFYGHSPYIKRRLAGDALSHTSPSPRTPLHLPTIGASVWTCRLRLLSSR